MPPAKGSRFNMELAKEDLDTVAKLMACVSGRAVEVGRTTTPAKVTLTTRRVPSDEVYAALVTALAKEGKRVVIEGDTQLIVDDEDGPAPPDLCPSSDVVKSGETAYRVDAAYFRAQLTDLEGLAKQARIIPTYRGGKPFGFKFVGIRPHSLYSRLGLRTGDQLVAFNGEAVTSPDRAVALYKDLAGLRSFAIEVERRGQPLRLTYGVALCPKP